MSPKQTKPTKVRSLSCHGSKALGYRHHPNCRPGRPMCAAMRAIQPHRRVCTCDAYLFPHRSSSGACGNEMIKWARQSNLSLDEVRTLCQASDEHVPF